MLKFHIKGVANMIYVIAVIIWGLIWGFVAKTVNENKGYEGGFWWGFWLGFIGLIVVACKPEKRSSYNDYITSTLLSETAEGKRVQQIISSGGWKCNKCERVNPSHTGTCGCGATKSDNEAKTRAALEEAKAKEKSESELENIQKLKSYKELLDSGVITQEDFNKKKAKLLNI